MIGLVKVSDVLAASDGVKPPATIDTADGSATKYWAHRLNISSTELFSAIEKVGPSVAAIRRHLHK
ncbi:MAG: DUF3606 domain-containing protein [Rhizobiales bacterium]|nr:DUF3606 domain-containing protein [Hyphomicrobiales bacterium]